MKLWTIQSAAAWAELQSKGVLRAPFSLTTGADPDWDNFVPAYNWMRDQMIARGIEPTVNDPDLYPIWAWSDHVVAFEEWALYKRRPKFWRDNNVLLEIDIPEERVLLSDYELWHLVLNGEHSTPEERAEWPRLVLDLTWEDPEYRVKNYRVQATFWELHLNQVQVIERRPVLPGWEPRK